MAKYVIAGASNCPFYARAELLADELALKLPSFSVHKIVINPSDWQTWVNSTCTENGWTYNGASPIVWRELINRGGKGTLLGGCDDFLEMVKAYYGITCAKFTKELRSIASENVETKVEADMAAAEKQESLNPFHLTITSVQSAPLAYHAIPLILANEKIVSTINDPIVLTLYEHGADEGARDAVEGIRMEVEDCSYPALKQVRTATTVKEAFAEANVVIIIDSCKQEEERSEHCKKLKAYAEEINLAVSNDTKIIVTGDEAIIDCYILSQIAKDVPRKNFLALSRHVENKIKAKLAKRMNIKTHGIQNLLVFGDPNKDFVADVNSTVALGYDGAIWGPHIEGFSHQITEIVYDKTWINEAVSTADPMEEPPKKSKQPAGVILPEVKEEKPKAIPTNGAMQKASSLVTQLEHLLDRTEGSSPEMFSLGLVSEGWFGVEEGLVFSFPVQFTNEMGSGVVGNTKVRDDVPLPDDLKEKIHQVASLVKEKSLNAINML